MMNLSDTIAEEVSTAELSGSRRLEERRLATVTETYVDQVGAVSRGRSGVGWG